MGKGGERVDFKFDTLATPGILVSANSLRFYEVGWTRYSIPPLLFILLDSSVTDRNTEETCCHRKLYFKGKFASS